MPASAFNALANNIGASINNAEALLGINGAVATGAGEPYPLSFITNANATAFDLSNWNKLPLPYTFGVVDRNGTPIAGFSDFELPLAPQNIMQTELFAHSIKPTQGGTVVTHSGNKYKALKISGTTGIAPFRGAGGVNKQTGAAIFGPGSFNEKSGYEVFQLLRNYFKAYYEFKNTGQLDRNARLVWKNYKDGEFLVVELMSFNMKRSAGRPFLYDYDIDCKVLKAFTFNAPQPGFLSDIETKITDALQKIENARGIFLGFQGSLRQIESTFNQTILEPLRLIGVTVKTFIGTALVLGDVGTRIITNTIALGGLTAILSSLLGSQSEGRRIGGVSQTLLDANLPTDPLNAAMSLGPAALINLGPLLQEVDLGDAPQATRDAIEKEVSELVLPRQFYTDAITELSRVKDNFEDFVGLNSAEYDRIFGRVETVRAETGRTVTNSEFDILNAFNQAITGIQDLISTSVLFRTSYSDEIANLISAFNDEIELEVQPAVREITLLVDQTLEKLALQFLADTKRWPEIAVLNGLKPPYICQRERFKSFRRSDGVIITDEDLLTADEKAMFNFSKTAASPGDSLLVPAPLIFGFGETPDGATISITRDLNQVEKNIGVDLRVDIETFDMILSNGGDLEAIAGAGNMAQSIILKLNYEKGDLLSNPEIGVGLIVGSKGKDLNSIRDDITRSLLQDPRIESLGDFRLVRNGPDLRIRFLANIKQVDQPVPIELALPVR